MKTLILLFAFSSTCLADRYDDQVELEKIVEQYKREEKEKLDKARVKYAREQTQAPERVPMGSSGGILVILLIACAGVLFYYKDDFKKKN